MHDLCGSFPLSVVVGFFVEAVVGIIFTNMRIEITDNKEKTMRV